MRALRQLPTGNGDFYEIMFEDTTVHRITFFPATSQTGIQKEWTDLDDCVKKKIIKLVFKEISK